MVDAQLMEQRGLQIVDMYPVFGDVVAVVVRLAVDRSPLKASARDPHTEAGAQVVATVAVRVLQIALHEDRSPELRAP